MDPFFGLGVCGISGARDKVVTDLEFRIFVRVLRKLELMDAGRREKSRSWRALQCLVYILKSKKV